MCAERKKTPKYRVKNRHFVPPSFQVYDLKHCSMKCYKAVAVHASKFEVDGEGRQ
jgi:hypothetical protein